MIRQHKKVIKGTEMLTTPFKANNSLLFIASHNYTLNTINSVSFPNVLNPCCSSLSILSFFHIRCFKISEENGLFDVLLSDHFP